ncbi:alpha/beta hydrolase family protein [Roseomonas marmotae]|uniref:AB hydrolase-1 domain-containing protein n=1 Tax=Roseomonas marmotae TaxID=2768161 RepID=A0ABS3KFG5_9PROT|nr:alpha/beta fold hydrolase [Roseomonas marmotae]MBO1075680.1 hypothetical protein [Roseomonas marmotae]QTI79538.1 hypothetical protein IAI58_01550 [Roseomonas marmotae]
MPEFRLAGFGSYTAGGRVVEISGEPVRELQFTSTTSYRHDPNGMLAIEHAYVQYFTPAARRGLPPVVLMHGGGMSGTMWETTPDGRPGWLHGLLAAGLEVHVVDNAERGRAGWCPVPGIWPGEPILRTIEESWTRFRFGETDADGRRQAFPGQRFPVAALEAFARGFVPRWTTLGDVAAASLGAVLRRVGPCILLCHSQGGEPAFRAAAAAPGLVRAMVAVEPTGFADPAALRGIPTLMVMGDYREHSAHWRGVSRRCMDFAEALTGQGGRADWLDLPAEGIHGNSHMPMMDDNNQEILVRILRWLDARLA